MPPLDFGLTLKPSVTVTFRDIRHWHAIALSMKVGFRIANCGMEKNRECYSRLCWIDFKVPDALPPMRHDNALCETFVPQKLPYNLHIPFPFLEMCHVRRLCKLDPLHLCQVIEESFDTAILSLIVSAVQKKNGNVDGG